MLIGGALITDDLSEVFKEPGWWYVVSLAVLFVHLVAFLSLWMRRAAFGLTVIGLVIAHWIGAGLLSLIINGGNDFEVVAVILTVMMLMVSVAPHPLIILRLMKLAGE